MPDPWTIYDNLVSAKDILGRVSRFAPAEVLDRAVDEAYNLLDNNLPELASAIEDMEEEE